MRISVCPDCHKAMREKTDFNLDVNVITVNLSCPNCEVSEDHRLEVTHNYLPTKDEVVGQDPQIVGALLTKYARQVITSIGMADVRSNGDTTVDMRRIYAMAREALELEHAKGMPFHTGTSGRLLHLYMNALGVGGHLARGGRL